MTNLRIKVGVAFATPLLMLVIGAVAPPSTAAAVPTAAGDPGQVTESELLVASVPELGTAEEYLSRSGAANDSIISALSPIQKQKVASEVKQVATVTVRSIEATSNRRLANQLMFADDLSSFISFRAWDYPKYPQFNWNTDLCSTGALRPLSVYYEGYFKDACVRHDFGYRNYGKGTKLHLDPTEAGRAKIDAQLRKDTEYIAGKQSNPTTRSNLSLGSKAFYEVLRKKGAEAYGL